MYSIQSLAAHPSAIVPVGLEPSPIIFSLRHLSSSIIYDNTVALVLLLNLITILLFFVAKSYYKKDNNTRLIAKISMWLTLFFILYTISLLVLLYQVFFRGFVLHSIILLIMAISPFIIGKIATYKKADFFINIQILTLILSLLILYIFY